MSSIKAGTIVVKLDLDDDKFSAKITGATTDLALLNRALGLSDQSIRTHERSVVSWGKRFRDTVIVLGMVRHALQNVNAMLLGFPRAILRANSELERMTFLMAGMSDATGGWDAAMLDAEKSVEYVFDLARTAPFEVAAITDSFVKLKASGIDPTKGGLQALIDSIAKFGGSSEHLKRASIAIQQMSGKGVISMEELRQQLGEAIPNAVMIMARSLNLSMGDLVKKISMGVVEAKGALGALFRQMEIENSGSAMRMSSTMEGLLARMKTRFTVFYKTIGDAGFFEEAKKSMADFVDGFMVSNEVMSFANSLGKAMASAIVWLRDATRFIYDNWEAIKTLVQSLAILRVAFMLTAATQGKASIAATVWTAAARIATGVSTLWATQTAFATKVMVAHGVAVTTSMRLISTSVAVAGVAWRALSATVVAAGAAMFAAIWPIAAVTAVVWALTKAVEFFLRSRKDLKAMNEDFIPDFATDKEIGELTAKLEFMSGKIAEVTAARADIEGGALQKLGFFRRRQLQASADMEFDLEDAILQRDLAQANIHEAMRAAAQKASDKMYMAGSLERSKKSLELQNQYVKDLEALRNEELSGEGSADERRAALMAGKQILDTALLDAQIALAKEQMDDYWKQIGELAEGDAGDEIRLGLYATIERIQAEIDGMEALKVPTDGLVIVAGSDDESPLDTWAKNIRAKIATVGAKIEEVSPEFEKFMSLLDSGDYGDLNEEERANAIAEAKLLTDELFKQQNIYSAQQAAKTQLTRETKNTLEVQAALTKKVAELNNDNPFRQAEVDVEGFRTQLQNTIDTLTEAQNTISEAGGPFSPELAAGIAAAGVELERLNGVRIEGPLAMMRRETLAISDSLLTQEEQLRVAHDRLTEYARQTQEANAATWSTEQAKVFADYMSALNQKLIKDTETPIQALMRTWSDNAKAMRDVGAEAMSSFVDSLADSLVDGELKFKEFTKNILKMILKIQLQKMVAGIATNFMPDFGSTVAASTRGTVNTGNIVGGFAMPFANGGIMTSQGAMTLRKYSKGGVSNAPQFSHFAEGDDPEAYVPLPDGRRIPVNVNMAGGGSGSSVTQVNVINQTSTPVSATEGQSRFDGSKFVKEVILKEIGKPGAFRDAMRGK